MGTDGWRFLIKCNRERPTVFVGEPVAIGYGSGTGVLTERESFHVAAGAFDRIPAVKGDRYACDSGLVVDSGYRESHVGSRYGSLRSDLRDDWRCHIRFRIVDRKDYSGIVHLAISIADLNRCRVLAFRERRFGRIPEVFAVHPGIDCLAINHEDDIQRAGSGYDRANNRHTVLRQTAFHW